MNAGAVNRLSHRGACQSRRVGLLRRRSPVCLVALGHTVRLIPPQYVKPFVKRGKNDSATMPRRSARPLGVPACVRPGEVDRAQASGWS